MEPYNFPLPGALVGKAREQLGTPERNQINGVAVTGIASVTDEFRGFCRDELSTARNVRVLVYRSFAGEAIIFSLNGEVAHLIAQKIPSQEAQPFQPFYFVMPDRKQAVLRQEQRPTSSGSEAERGAADLVEIAVPSLPPRKMLLAPPLAYRCNLRRRLPSGEPVFEHVPPYVSA